MPKELLHWKIAEKSLNKIKNSDFKKLIEENLNYFLLGAVFPDTLLYGITSDLNNFKNAGLYIHENDIDFLDFFKNIPESDNFDLISVFIAGIVTHLEADAVFHPAIYSFSGTSLKTHYLIETALDMKLAFEITEKYSVKSLLNGIEINKLELIVYPILNFFNINQKLLKIYKIHSFLQQQFKSGFAAELIEFIDFIFMGKIVESELFYRSDSIKKASFFLDAKKYDHPATKEIFDFSINQLESDAVNNCAFLIEKLSHHKNQKEFMEIIKELKVKNFVYNL